MHGQKAVLFTIDLTLEELEKVLLVRHGWCGLLGHSCGRHLSFCLKRIVREVTKSRRREKNGRGSDIPEDQPLINKRQVGESFH